MDSASDEINILLPLAFSLFVLCFALIGSLILWLLFKFEVVKFSNKHLFFSTLKGVFLSFFGVIVLYAVISGFINVLNIAISFFSK
ncbi:hypothetical protein BH10ACI1_BH10ACI1_17780 [soil metagenome]